MRPVTNRLKEKGRTRQFETATLFGKMHAKNTSGLFDDVFVEAGRHDPT
jgi:hypothetical protein